MHVLAGPHCLDMNRFTVNFKWDGFAADWTFRWNKFEDVAVLSCTLAKHQLPCSDIIQPETSQPWDLLRRFTMLQNAKADGSAGCLSPRSLSKPIGFLTPSYRCPIDHAKHWHTSRGPAGWGSPVVRSLRSTADIIIFMNICLFFFTFPQANPSRTSKIFFSTLTSREQKAWSA